MELEIPRIKNLLLIEDDPREVEITLAPPEARQAVREKKKVTHEATTPHPALGG